MTREEILNHAMTSPDEFEIAAGVRFRKTDLQAEMMCCRAGVAIPSPEDFVKMQSDPRLVLSLFPRISEFVYIHAAPRAEVEKVIYETPSELPRLADRFFGRLTPEKLDGLLAFIYLDRAAIAAAQAEAIPDEKLPTSKNAPSPAARQA